MNLKPEELVKALLYCGNGGDCDSCCHPCHGEHGEFEWRCLGPLLLRLRELAMADQKGRVIVLPCKVGDVVYGFYGEQTILPMVAKWIETNTDGWTVAAQYAPMSAKFYLFSDFGKTVFLTSEEAKKALEARK